MDQVLALFKAGYAGEIVETQTTFLDLVCRHPEAPKTKYRIHFRAKHEFSLAKDTIRSLTLLEEHPLLLEYVEPFKEIYLAGVVSDKRKFVIDLESEASKFFEGWRSVYRYANGMPFDELLEKSYGLLMAAPASYAKLVMEVAARNGVALNILEAHRPIKEKPRLLLLDRYYVVANDFVAELS